MTQTVKNLGFRLEKEKYRIETSSHVKNRILLELFIGLLRDDDAYIGLLYEYLVAVIMSPRYHMLSGFIVERIFDIAGDALAAKYPG